MTPIFHSKWVAMYFNSNTNYTVIKKKKKKTEDKINKIKHNLFVDIDKMSIIKTFNLRGLIIHVTTYGLERNLDFH